MKRLAPIQSLAQLRTKALRDENYKRLAIFAAQQLGGETEDLNQAMKYLETSANDTDEDEVVEEVNFCLAELGKE